MIAQLTGRRIVQMVHEDLRILKILKRENFLNAVRANGALGGSTNAVIHLLAIAGRAGVEFGLDDWDRYGREIPTLVDIMPSGRFLMEDYYYAGGLPAVLRTLGEHGLLDKGALTVTGQIDVGQRQGRAQLEHRGDPHASTTRTPRTAGSPCCAATSPPTARCSSRRPRRPR